MNRMITYWPPSPFSVATMAVIAPLAIETQPSPEPIVTFPDAGASSSAPGRSESMRPSAALTRRLSLPQGSIRITSPSLRTSTPAPIRLMSKTLLISEWVQSQAGGSAERSHGPAPHFSVLLLDGTCCDARCDVALGERQEDRRRDDGYDGRRHDGWPFHRVRTDEPVDAHGDRCVVWVVVKDKGEQEVTPAEEEREETGGDQRRSTERKVYGPEDPQWSSPIDLCRFRQFTRYASHEGSHDDDGEWNGDGRVGEDHGLVCVEKPQAVEGRVERDGDDKPGSHLSQNQSE